MGFQYALAAHWLLGVRALVRVAFDHEHFQFARAGSEYDVPVERIGASGLLEIVTAF